MHLLQIAEYHQPAESSVRSFPVTLFGEWFIAFFCWYSSVVGGWLVYAQWLSGWEMIGISVLVSAVSAVWCVHREAAEWEALSSRKL